MGLTSCCSHRTQYNSDSVPGRVTFFRRSDVFPSSSCLSSGSELWDLARALRSIGRAISSTLDRVSATTLFLLEMCLISVVNCEMKSNG